MHFAKQIYCVFIVTENLCGWNGDGTDATVYGELRCGQYQWPV